MTRHTACLSVLLFLALGFSATQSARPFPADDVPAWLKQVSTAPIPTYDKDVPAVVLYDEAIVTVSPDGHIRTNRSYAIRILTRKGNSMARAAEEYNT